MRKRRSDSILGNLPEATQRAIYALEAEERLGIAEIAGRLEMPECEGGFGVGHVSLGAISNFLREMRTTLWRERLRSATATVDEAATEIDGAGEVLDDGILAGIREWVLDTLVKGEMSPKDAKGLVGLILKGRAQNLDARKVALLERKAAAFDELSAAVKAPGGISEDTLEQIERRAKLL